MRITLLRNTGWPTLLLLAAALICGCSQPAVPKPVPTTFKNVKPMPKAGDLTVIFVRHAETMANYSGKYNTKTLNEFSPNAQKTIDALVKKLHTVKIYDAVVSPQWRTVATIAPVLRDHHLTGQLWPELNECCSQARSKRSQPARPHILYGGQIKVPKGFEDCVKPDPNDPRWIANGNYQDGIQQIKLLTKKFLQRFSGKHETVLVVGHGYCGGRFLEMLLGMPPIGRIVPGNATTIVLHQKADGKFEMVSMVGSAFHKKGN